MKILYIVPKINDEGGVARVLSVKANYLAEKLGYDVHILTQNRGNLSLFYFFNTKIKLHDIPLIGNRLYFFFQYVKGLKTAVKFINPDIIVVCDNGLKAYTIPLILKTKRPIVFECHGSKFIEDKKGSNLFFFTKLKLFFKEYTARKFTKFIALSPESLKEWKVENGIILPNPLWFSTNDFSDLKSKKILVIARHSYEKGLDRILKIWEKVVENYPDWRLEIYGKSDKNQEFKRMSNALGVDKKVVFFEPVHNITEKYLEASIVAMTSRTEGFPMVLLEAMAMGLPCIAYDCPVGPSSVITNNVDGYLIENGNEEQFVKKLSALMGNKDLRKKLGQNGKESVLRFDIDTIMNQWKTLFEDLVKK